MTPNNVSLEDVVSMATIHRPPNCQERVDRVGLTWRGVQTYGSGWVRRVSSREEMKGKKVKAFNEIQ